MFCAFTLLSPQLAPSAALICISNQFPGWINRLAYNQQPKDVYWELLESFYKAEREAVKRLNYTVQYSSLFKDDKMEAQKKSSNKGKSENAKELFKLIRRANPRYKYISDFQNIQLSTQDAACLLRESIVLRKTCTEEKSADQLEMLEKMEALYTSYFFAAMAQHVQLSRWFDYVAEIVAADRYGSIQKALLSSDAALRLILGHGKEVDHLQDEKEEKAGKILLLSLLNIYKRIPFVAVYSFLTLGLLLFTSTLLGVTWTSSNRAYFIVLPLFFLLGEGFLDAVDIHLRCKHGLKIRENALRCLGFCSILRCLGFHLCFAMLRSVLIGTVCFIAASLCNYPFVGTDCRWVRALLISSAITQLIRFLCSICQKGAHDD